MWTKLLIVGLLGLIVGIPFVLQPAETKVAPQQTAGTLVVLTPHNEQIRYEFARAFNAGRTSQGLKPVHFDWRSGGGTSDQRKMVLSQYEAAAAAGHEDAGIGVDLFFGGGDYEHSRLAQGITVTRGGQTVTIPLTIPAKLPDGMLEAVYPQPVIGDAPLYDQQRRWLGVTLASFGIVYNRDVLNILQLPEPTTWSDLTDPRLRGWVALADPAHSGSIGVTYNAILRRHGWTEGWKLLRRAFANARNFATSSSNVPVNVSAGDSAAGMCIDFYGRFQAQAIAAAGQGPPRVGYVDPAGLTAITADPISIMLGTQNYQLANTFVIWLLSPPGQRLWQRRLGEEDGPTQFELRRLPVRRDMYTPQEMAYWTDSVEPFAIAKPFPRGMPDYYGAVSPVAHMLGIDVHADLVAAWEAIQSQTDPAVREKMLTLFDAMPGELTLSWPNDELAADWRTIIENATDRRYDEVTSVLATFSATLQPSLADPDARLRWTKFFRGNYRAIVDIRR